MSRATKAITNGIVKAEKLRQATRPKPSRAP
jgi:hypothetical protein